VAQEELWHQYSHGDSFVAVWLAYG